MEICVQFWFVHWFACVFYMTAFFIGFWYLHSNAFSTYSTSMIADFMYGSSQQKYYSSLGWTQNYKFFILKRQMRWTFSILELHDYIASSCFSVISAVPNEVFFSFDPNYFVFYGTFDNYFFWLVHDSCCTRTCGKQKEHSEKDE